MNTFNKVSIGVVVAAMLMAGGSVAFGQERGEKRGKGGALDAAALTCVQAAIDARDNAVIMGLDAYYPAAKTAIQTRQAALKAAWMQTDQVARKAATKTAWDAYNKSVKSARMTMKTAHKTAWAKFESDRKACNPKAGSDDKGSLGADNQL